MSLNQFYLIITYLKLGNPNLDDKLARIRDLSNHIQLVSQRIYSPRKNLSIDESMISYKERHGLKQYMPMKPTKWGFKAFLLCEAITDYVYIHKFLLGLSKKNSSLSICV